MYVQYHPGPGHVPVQNNVRSVIVNNPISVIVKRPDDDKNTPAHVVK